MGRKMGLCLYLSDLTFTVSLSKLHILEPMWHFDIRVYFITLRGLEYNETSVSLTTSSFEGV